MCVCLRSVDVDVKLVRTNKEGRFKYMFVDLELSIVPMGWQRSFPAPEAPLVV
jgi:hypothetical protein